MTSINEPVDPDQLRVSVEMGDQYTPNDRVAAALNELAAALQEGDDDVEGFALGGIELTTRSFTHDSVGRLVEKTGYQYDDYSGEKKVTGTPKK